MSFCPWPICRFSLIVIMKVYYIVGRYVVYVYVENMLVERNSPYVHIMCKEYLFLRNFEIHENPDCE
jgi:hypothetical protein